MGTLEQKWGPNVDPKAEKGPHGDPVPQMGTHVATVLNCYCQFKEGIQTYNIRLVCTVITYIQYL